MKNKKSILALVGAIFLAGAVAYAANTPTLNQAINAGSKSVDIVDSGGTTVASPAVTFGALTFSFNTQDGTGTLPSGTDKIRVSNPTGSVTWTVNMAATSGATAVWTDGGTNTYDFNDGSGYTDGADADSVGGQMTVDPSGGTLTGVSGCATTNVTKGTSDSFVQASVDSIDLFSAAAGASAFCRWDLTGVAMTQKIPASQAAASYSISMTLTII